MDFTQENFNKLLEVADNKEKALQEERSKRKQLREEFDTFKTSQTTDLEELKKFKTEIEEKKLKDKWKLDELLANKEKEIETYKAQLTEHTTKIQEYEGYKTKFETHLQSQLDSKLASIPDDKKEFVNKVIDWKDFESKVELLDWFAKEYEKPWFSGWAPDWKKDVSWVEQKPANLNEAINQIFTT